MATCVEDFKKTVIVADGITSLFAVEGAASPYAANYRVDIDGVLQEPDTDYTIDSTGNIEFTSVPPAGSKIVVIADSTDATIFIPNQPLQNISPNAPEVTTILRTECIGNSLATINNNFANLKHAICTIDNFVAAANVRINLLDSLLTDITPQRLAKAFISFNGTKNTAGEDNLTDSQRQIIQSYNVNNVVRYGAGKYVISFEPNTFLDAKYIMNGTTRFPNIVTYSNSGPGPTDPPTTLSYVTILVMDNDRNLVDTDLISLTFFNN
jgi:hypothetical protein